MKYGLIVLFTLLMFLLACQAKSGGAVEGMINIPGGKLDLNTFKYHPPNLPTPLPPELVKVKPFFIDKYEVTNGKYKQCVAAGACVGVDVPKPFAEDNQPVVFVNWKMAQKYCQFVGKRLPTNNEWEFAARDSNNQFFPYGNDFDPNKANMSYAQPFQDYRFTAPVGSYPGDVSCFGVYDMGGNVQEFVSDLPASVRSPGVRNPHMSIPDAFNQTVKRDYAKIRVARGGGWYKEKVSSAIPYIEVLGSSDGSSREIGFRCAKDAD
jgi:formylglycine-generating enzyme